MNAGGLLLAAAFATPILLAAAIAVFPAWRSRALDLLAVAPLPGLLAALFAPGKTLAVAPEPMRMVLELDTPGAVLLGGASLLWLCAGLYARSYLAEDSRSTRFAVCWLFTLAGTLGTFLVADLASFYLVFALASLPAYGLVTHEASPRAARAGYIYMLLAMVGEAALLFAFVLLAVGSPENPLIRDAVAGLGASAHSGLIVTLLIIGFGLKMGLVPLHVWMPLAHPVAPMPASAALSGIVVKAGVIGLIRFLPLDGAMPVGGAILTGLGLATAFYAALVGVTQTHPKTVLAYSTVSQMGLVAALLGTGLAAGSPVVAAFAAYYALHHMLVKGALFLGVGISAARWRHGRLVMLVMAVLSLSLAGLPLTSGALAKYAAKAAMGEGMAALLATIAATGSTVLMLHFLSRLAAAVKEGRDVPPPRGLLLPWAAIAVASFVVPWALFAKVTGYPLAAVLGPAALWKATWPILLGVAIALALSLRGRPLPALPEGDVVRLAEAAVPGVDRLIGATLNADAVLRRWPVATGMLAFFILALAWTFVA